MRLRTRITIAFAIVALIGTVTAKAPQKPLTQRLEYHRGDRVPISCLNRTIETGEHIQDKEGLLQYVPFPTCNETGKPLELQYGIDQDVKCTIASITDPMYHLFEFYIHHDSPLTCRIPKTPLEGTFAIAGAGSKEQDAADYIPLVFALSGVLQLSHLHIAPELELLVHTPSRKALPPHSPKTGQELASIESAIAYSRHPHETSKIVIGDPLTLRCAIRWPGTTEPQASVLVYCLVSAAISAGLCTLYFKQFAGRSVQADMMSQGMAGGGYGYGYNDSNRNMYSDNGSAGYQRTAPNTIYTKGD